IESSVIATLSAKEPLLCCGAECFRRSCKYFISHQSEYLGCLTNPSLPARIRTRTIVVLETAASCGSRQVERRVIPNSMSVTVVLAPFGLLLRAARLVNISLGPAKFAVERSDSFHFII